MKIKEKQQVSEEMLEKLITDAFHKVDLDLDYIYKESDKLITTARYYGLTKLANELENLK